MTRPTLYEMPCNRKVSVKLTTMQYDRLVLLKEELNVVTIGDVIRVIINRFVGASSNNYSPPAKKIEGVIVTKTGVVLPLPGKVNKDVPVENAVPKKSFAELKQSFIDKGFSDDLANSMAIEAIK